MSIKEKIAEIKIPSYSHKEELFNFVSHLSGLPLAIFIFIMAIIKYTNRLIGFLDVIGLSVFAIAAFIVFFVSSLYHGMRQVSNKKKVLRVVDHCAIYLLIAGTYTPVTLVIAKQSYLGVVMLIIEWVGALLGIILNAFFFRNKVSRIISFALYIVMGWLCAFCCAWLYLNAISFLFILIGGCVYTIGSILYGVGKANSYFHCIFHVFVLFGTIVQTIGVFLMY